MKGILKKSNYKMKKFSIVFILVFCATVIFAQKATKTVNLQEGKNTVQLTKHPFYITINDGVITSVFEKEAEFTAYKSEPALLMEKLISLDESIDIKKEGAVWEKGQELLFIKISEAENGHSVQFYLFEK